MANITWIGAANGLWSDTANWSTNTVPTAADNVTVNTNVNINVDIDVNVTQLNLLAGNLIGAGNAWSGSFDVAQTASVKLNGTAHTFATGTIFNGLGLVEVETGELEIEDGVEFQTKFEAKSKVKVKNKATFKGETKFASEVEIADAATLELNGANCTIDQGADFTGTGLVDHVSGNLDINAETSFKSKFKSKSSVKIKNKVKFEGDTDFAGVVDLADTSTLELIGTNHIINTGADFTGLGTFDHLSGNLDINAETSFKSKFKSKSSVKIKNKVKFENDATISGAVDIANGALVDFAEGIHTIDIGSSFTGAGKLRVSGGSLTVNQQINVGVLELTGGNVVGQSNITANTIVENLALTLAEGQNKVITNQFLEITDNDASADQIIYTLTDLPDGGQLLLNGVALAVGSTFTQAQINSKSLTFADGETELSGDSFGFSVTANGEQITTSTFALDFASIAQFQQTGTAGIFAFAQTTNLAQLQFTINNNGISGRQISEFGLFFTDNEQGLIDGIAPGQAGYQEAALGRAQLIQSILSLAPNGFEANSRILELATSNNFGFYFVKEGSAASGNAASNVILSTSQSLEVAGFSSSSFNLNFDDNGDASFNELQVSVESILEEQTLGTALQGGIEGEVIDLTAVQGQVSASFEVTREAQFDNTVGFYAVANEAGAVLDPVTGQLVNPGDANYAQIAIEQRVSFELSVQDNGTANISGDFAGGSIFAPFLIVDASIEAFLSGGANAFFNYGAANFDGQDHIKLLADNTFGFEDIAGVGSDFDYNDVTIKFELAVA
ncbi:MAG: cadherin-like domain-containing protein [Coleofasciculaceae cyanobacterium]